MQYCVGGKWTGAGSELSTAAVPTWMASRQFSYTNRTLYVASTSNTVSFQISNGLKNRLVADAVPTIFSVRNLVIFLRLLNIVMVRYREFFYLFPFEF